MPDVDAPKQGSRRVIAFVNPATRRDAATLTAALREAAPRDIDLRIVETTPYPLPQDLIDPTALPDIVVAIGGDGTVSAVATLLGPHPSIPLAIIPAGSTNVIAKGLGIPRKPEEAAALVFGDHRVRRIDVGECNGHRFLHMAGIGFDARLFERASHRWKRKVGWLAYLPAALNALRVPPSRLSITADGRTIEITSSFVLLANGNFVIHPGLRLSDRIHPDDGELDIIIFTATTPVAYARTIARLLARSLLRSPFVMHLRAMRLTVTANESIPFECDGDVAGHVPVEVRLSPRAQQVIVPPPR